MLESKYNNNIIVRKIFFKDFFEIAQYHSIAMHIIKSIEECSVHYTVNQKKINQF